MDEDKEEELIRSFSSLILYPYNANERACIMMHAATSYIDIQPFHTLENGGKILLPLNAATLEDYVAGTQQPLSKKEVLWNKRD